MDLFTICIHHSELQLTLFTDTHRLVSSVYYNLHLPFPGNGFYRGRFFSFPRSGPLVTAARAEFLTNYKSTNWVPGWRLFHTNLLVFSSQAAFQLTTEPSHSPTSYFTSLHSTELLTTLTSNSLVQTVLLITSRNGPYRNHLSHCYN
jgi:hypothetical protein